MRRFVSFWGLLFLVIIAFFAMGRSWKTHHLFNFSEEDFLSGGFLPTEFPIENHFFTFVIYGFNNGAFVEKTLNSVFSQYYDPYRVIYLDDGSTDGSFDFVQEWIVEKGFQSRTTFLRSLEKVGYLASVASAIKCCQDDEIIVLLNGEDRLAHEWVLSFLNRYYANPDLWLTYGQYREIPTYREGICRPYTRKEWESVRTAPFVASHLKTFYTGLFKRIEGLETLYREAISPRAADLAFMIPLLEMAKEHTQWISQTLYLSTRVAFNKEEREEIARIERKIRNSSPLGPVELGISVPRTEGEDLL